MSHEYSWGEGKNLKRLFKIFVCFWFGATFGCSEQSTVNNRQTPASLDASIGVPQDGSTNGSYLDGGDSADAQTTPAQWTTQTVYEAMKPLCANCHGEGQSSPYFESLSSFVSGIVSDEAYVVLGDPDGSEFLSLLVGAFDGPLPQMPPTATSYAELVDGDNTKPNMDDLSDWIANLTEIPEVSDGLVCAPLPMPKLMHRLNRLEYNHSVHAILGT